jgi:magnesium transporter
MALELEEISLQQKFNEVIVSEDKLLIQEFLNNQNISDVADIIYGNVEFETQIMAHISLHRAASVFKILELPTQKRIIKNLPAFKTAELLNELPPDDRTAFLSELPSNAVRELVKTLNPEERKITLSLLGYPENSVGRLMTPDYIYVYEQDSVEHVFNTIRRYAKSSETIDVLYVLNDKGELLDDIRIKDFIMATPDKKVCDLMDGRFISLQAEDDQEVASEVFKMNNRVALPVVSKSNKLLGIVTIDDVLWVTEEEYTEDIQKIGGTEALDEPYLDVPLLKLYRKRIIWLLILFVGETFTIAAMSGFQKTLEHLLVLSTFIPLIISSGGNSGSQAATLIIQALALGEITIADWWRIAKREIISGLLMGVTLGIIGFFIIFIGFYVFHLFGVHHTKIGFAIGIAIIGVVVWGTIMGSMLPLLLKRLGADPATSSTPFIATLVDVTGLLIYFSVAYLFLQDVLV